MKIKDIRTNVYFTVLATADGLVYNSGLIDYTQTKLNLTGIFALGNKYTDAINTLRSMEYHSKEQKEYKKLFPCWIVGGVCEFENVSDSGIITKSNIMSIDIDFIDNDTVNIDAVRNEILNLPYVIGVFKSISGTGLYALILVEDGNKTKDYYRYICSLWNKQYGINVDESACNIARKRFISYEDNIWDYIKDDDVDIVPWKLTPLIIPEEKYEPRVPLKLFHNNNDNSKELTHKAIELLLDSGYSADNFKECRSGWYHVACDFVNFDDGLDLFVKFSNNSSKYNDDYSVIRAKYNEAKPSNIDEVNRKWQGMAKRIFGTNWYKRK